MKTATVSVSPSLSIADFGIGARTAIKTRPSPSTNYDTTTRMAASRSLPNSPRLLQYSNDTNIIVRPTASPPMGLARSVGSPGNTHRTDSPPSQGKSVHVRSSGKKSPVQIKKLVWTTSSGKTVTHTMPEGRASRPVTSEARIPARRRLWDKYEFSSDEEENEDGDDTRFHELNQNSEDSRHFYVPPLNHEGLIMRPESGA